MSSKGAKCTTNFDFHYFRHVKEVYKKQSLKLGIIPIDIENAYKKGRDTLNSNGTLSVD